MRKKNKLTLEERESLRKKIAVALSDLAPKPIKEIAQELNIGYVQVYRMLNRNSRVSEEFLCGVAEKLGVKSYERI